MANTTPSVTKRGIDLIRDPHHNKSTAFTEAEREALGLVGLLPTGVDTEETQVCRALQQLGFKTTDLERYIYLIGLLDTNETLFYKLLMSDPARFLPIVYAPTVGEACLKFGHIFRRPRGTYLSLKLKGRVKQVLRNWPERDVRMICVTSGGRILGLGDLGANGMGIPIGKLQLYTACAGVPPQFLLPMHIDFGTNNQALLNDPLYLGLRQPRVPAAQVDEFCDEVLAAVQEVFPGCCIHFEDWTGVDAVRHLDRYRDRICCFNDDIQGTAGVVLAGIFSALQVTCGKLRDQRVLFLGAGSAGIGIANLIASAMELEGLTADEARSRIWLFDVNGLLDSRRTDLYDFQKPYAHSTPPRSPPSEGGDEGGVGGIGGSLDFVSVIESIKPTVLIGVSTQGKAFNQKVVEAMARLNERPIIFALSNPTDHAECTAEEVYGWSDGRALYAAGVPFPPVRHREKICVPGQCNNLYVFPALGLAVIATKAKRVTEEMFITAARAVTEQVTPAELNAGLLYPPLNNIMKTEIAVAEQIAKVIFARGLAGVEEPGSIRAFLESQLYEPLYHSLL